MMDTTMSALGFLQTQSHAIAVDGVSSWVMQTGVAVSLLIIGVLFMRRPFAKIFGAQAAYGLWLLPVLRLFMPSLSVPEAWLFWRAKTAPMTAPPDAVSPLINIPVDNTLTAVATPFNWTALALLIWCVGAVVWLLWQGRIYRRARRDVMANSDDAGASIQTLAENCALRLGLKHLPEIRISRFNHGPMVLGLLRPIVIVPRDFSAHFTPQQQRFALMHELAHIGRRDLWAAFGALLFRAINWPNPLVHYAHRRFRIDQEAACDATVLRLIDGIDARQSYGQTLLSAAKLSIRPDTTTPLIPHKPMTDVPIGLTLNHPLKERLMTLKTPIKKASWLTKTAAMSAILAGCAVSAPYTVAQDETLAGGYSVTKTESKGAHKIVVREDDGTVILDETYEVQSDDNGIRAWKIDGKSGKKTALDASALNDVPGLSVTTGPNGAVTLLADELLYVPAPPMPPMAKGGALLPPPSPMAPFVSVDKSGDGSMTVIMRDGQPLQMPSDGKGSGLEYTRVIQMQMDGAQMELDISRAQIMAARSILEEMSGNDVPEVKRELERARKALKEATAAMERAQEK